MAHFLKKIEIKITEHFGNCWPSIPVDQVVSVTKFGEISPFWQRFKYSSVYLIIYFCKLCILLQNIKYLKI